MELHHRAIFYHGSKWRSIELRAENQVRVIRLKYRLQSCRRSSRHRRLLIGFFLRQILVRGRL